MYYESLCTLYNHWPPALKLCHWPFDEVLLMMMILSFNDDDDNNKEYSLTGVADVPKPQ